MPLLTRLAAFRPRPQLPQSAAPAGGGRRACFGALLALVASSTAADAAPPRVAKVELVIGSRLPAEGGPEMTPASPLKSPFGVDFDAAGTMFIVELEGGRMFERGAEGVVRQISGDGSKSYKGDGGPLGKATYNGMHNVAITKSGRMLIADTWNNCVREVDLQTRTIRTLAGIPQAASAATADRARRPSSIS